MRNGSYENSSVETVSQKLPEARAYLRQARIDRTGSMFLRDAAAAASITPDELLAQIEARLRRQARRATPTPVEVEHTAAAEPTAEREFMLV